MEQPAIPPGGALIGILAEPRLAARTVRLGPGDTLVLYSDGLTEARSGPDGARYGETALLGFFRTVAPAAAAEVVGSPAGLLTTFAEVDDDVAVIALIVSEDAAVSEDADGGGSRGGQQGFDLVVEADQGE